MSSKHRRITGFVLALVIAAIAVPSASARPGEQFLNLQPASPATARPQVLPNPDNQQPNLSSHSVRVSTPNPGFDWGDAGIGAGAGVALTMIGLGGVLVLSSRRHRHGPATTA